MEWRDHESWGRGTAHPDPVPTSMCGLMIIASHSGKKNIAILLLVKDDNYSHGLMVTVKHSVSQQDSGLGNQTSVYY